jgi:2-phospho-L-lactate guanylyltransferase
MTFWIIIPAQAFDRGKTRLASALGPAERRAFSRASLRHVTSMARQVAGARRTLVVSRSGEVMGLARRLGVLATPEREPGLNGALRGAVWFARRRGATGIVVLHADLPEIESSELRGLLRSLARHRGVVIAPDRDREGTNALGLRPPGKFTYRFGAGSFDKHRAEARRRRRRVRVIESPGLARDVDTPEQYRHYAESAPALRALSRPT